MGGMRASTNKHLSLNTIISMICCSYLLLKYDILVLYSLPCLQLHLQTFIGNE